MTKFKKGESGNPAGKAPGTLNKSTTAVKKKIQDILNTNFTTESLAKDLKEIKPYERLKIFMRLIEFEVPRMRSTELTMQYDKMSEQDLDIIIKRLIESSDSS